MLSFHIDNQSRKPLYEQIYDAVKGHILCGDLKTGDKLPSTRGLASTLGVSRNTVDTAYYQLLAEGYIDTAPKSGFYVCELEIGTMNRAAYPPPSQKTPEEMTADFSPSGAQIDFSPFAVDISHFPYSIWKKLSKKTLDDSSDLFLQGDRDGDFPLRQAICDYVRMSREVHCTPEQIIVGAGADYLLQMLSLTFQHMGIQEITLENPCYQKAAMIFQNNGFRIHAGTLDAKGLTLSSMPKQDGVVYVTPSHQYPLGIVMPYGRRGELLGWADQTDNRYIIEDDHDSEFRYKGKPIPALQGMDQNGNVIYLGTFSNAVAPAIRVSYLILPNRLLDAYHQFCGFYSCTVSRLDQGILTRFLTEGYFEKHVNRMRKIYRSKHDLVLDLLKPLTQSGKIKIQGEHAGLHLVISFPEGTTEQSVIRSAASEGIILYGMQKHYLNKTDRASHAILFGYANVTEDKIQEGITILRNQWK